MVTLETLNFDNQALRSLPVDSSDDNSIRIVSNACYTFTKLTPVEKPELVHFSDQAMSLLDLPQSELQRENFVNYFSGNVQISGSQLAAHCYCGYQYGVFSGQLGDGAVMYIGEVVNKKGERLEVQLKGSGQTSFSKKGDGRKSLRSSIREFLCSEAMYFLGIPTTRAGSCITSSTMIDRDVLCDGKISKEKATVVTRLAPTFLRFGSFEICVPKTSEFAQCGPSVGRIDILKQLLDYTIRTFFPEIEREANISKRYKLFFQDVVHKTAKLVAHWQCVGFCHGVLNTDNMSILGLTLDYGPFCFMDYFESDHVSNSTDYGLRYSYKAQPDTCLWNLSKLAEALQPCLLSDTFDDELKMYWKMYEEIYIDTMHKKFGLFKKFDADRNLFDSFLNLLEDCGGDFTNCFRCLSLVTLPGCTNHAISIAKLIEQLLCNFSTCERMKLKLKNALDEKEIDFLMSLYESQPDILEEMHKNRKVLQELREMSPTSKGYNDKVKCTKWVAKYIDRLKIEVSGVQDVQKLNYKREQMMNSVNPRFVLRNYLAQNAIHKAEMGDYSEVRELLKILTNPYTQDGESPKKKHKLSSSSGACT